MPTRYRVAVIGCGRPEGTEGATGFGVSHMHAQGYQATGRCDLVAVADVRRENAAAFSARWGRSSARGGAAEPGVAIYVDYRAMLAEARPEIVSVCTWAHLHAEMVITCAAAGVKAVHCEKPMATTWEDARRMAAACEQAGTQLTINHQNRFREPYRVARDLVRNGRIGELQRLEGTSSNLTNSHWLDLLFFYNEETPAEWVMGQLHGCREGETSQTPREEQGICYVKFVNEVRALLLTGADAEIGCVNRLIGTEGSIEVHGEAPRVRLWGRDRDAARGAGARQSCCQSIEVPDGPEWQPAIDRAIADVVAALDEGREPELSARRALQSAEVIFATYESRRRRGRVDLPLPIDAAPPPGVRRRQVCEQAGWTDGEPAPLSG